MPDEGRVGYEDLLKPLKDQLLKNWSMSLAHVLEEYICHLQRRSFSNFTQAAMLLQNSATFYCKRVDVVYQIIEALIDGVSQFSDKCTNPSTVKRRRLVRVLENDDLELLDFVHTDANLDANVGKYSTSPPPKQIVVNKNVNAVRKPKTSIRLLMTSEVVMGCKDDFRLFWNTWDDGTVNEEFKAKSSRLQYVNSPAVVNGNGVHSPSNVAEDDLFKGLSCSAEQSEASANVEPCETANEPFELPPLVVKEVRVKLCRVVDWEPVTFSFKFPLRELKRRRAFELPDLLIEEAKEEAERQKKRKTRREKKIAELLNGSALPQEPANLSNGDTAMCSCINDWPEADAGVSSTDQFGSKRPFEELVDEDNEIQRFKLQRRESAAAAEEVARRVADWHEAVLPHVQLAQSRKKFNVHEYSDQLLARFPDDDSIFRPFTDIVRGQPRHEICRYFLSSLMLANTYNLQIKKTDDAPLATNCLELKLLTKARHQDADG